MFGYQVIQVKFNKFVLEADPYCRFDYVAFFNGGEKSDSRLIGRYCGDQVPQWVVFKSFFDILKDLTWINFTHSVPCTDPLFLVAMCCWSSSCLTSAWRLMASWPTTPASQPHRQLTREPAQGLSRQTLKWNMHNPNAPPPLCSRLYPPPDMCPLLPLSPPWGPSRSSPREVVVRAPQTRTGRCPSQKQMEGGQVGEVMFL